MLKALILIFAGPVKRAANGYAVNLYAEPTVTVEADAPADDVLQ